MKVIKTVLMSTASLPHEGVASWTTLMNYLLEKENQIDYLIGPKSNIKIDKPIQVNIGQLTFLDKLKKKTEPLCRFNPYIRALKKILDKEQYILLQVKDNFGLLKAALKYVKDNNLRKRVYVQYHYHSFKPFTTNEFLLNQIDEVVLLTESSYKEFKSTLNSFPIRTSINNDGINGEKFKPVDQKKKSQLRKKYQLDQEALIFIWCSQNRQKKGLDLALQVWQELSRRTDRNMKLLVFGVNKKIDIPNVVMMGLTPNEDLIEFYQLSDFYLFPTLWQEGFGLSLLEALKCGLYCIAANNGAVPEVLNYGEYGKLIDYPNLMEAWIEAIENSIQEYEENQRINPYLSSLPENLYDIGSWYQRYNHIIKESKKVFDTRYYLS